MKRPVSRTAQMLRILLGMSVLGGVLSAYSVINNGRDVRLATGPKSESQRQFFVEAATRPDLLIFFKALTPAQRIAMSRAIGRYDDALDAPLIATCLESFDVPAREALTAALGHVATVQPKAVVALFDQSGGFKQRAIRLALHPLGDAALELVAPQLRIEAARPNAADFLVESGPSAASHVIPMLNDTDAATRQAAADVLGKLRASSAISNLLSLVGAHSGNERAAYLGAICAIGDPKTEHFVRAELNNAANLPDLRAQCAIGLGLIGTDTAMNELSKHLDDDETSVRQGAIEGLRLVGAKALKLNVSLRDRLEVAAAVSGPESNAVVAAALKDPALAERAGVVSVGRTELESALCEAIVRYDHRGEIVSACVHALAASRSGRQLLTRFSDNEAIAGFVQRELGQP